MRDYQYLCFTNCIFTGYLCSNYGGWGMVIGPCIAYALLSGLSLSQSSLPRKK